MLSPKIVGAIMVRERGQGRGREPVPLGDSSQSNQPPASPVSPPPKRRSGESQPQHQSAPLDIELAARNQRYAMVSSALRSWKEPQQPNKHEPALPVDNQTRQVLRTALSTRLDLVRAKAARRILVRQDSFEDGRSKKGLAQWRCEAQVDCLALDGSWWRGVVVSGAESLLTHWLTTSCV